MVMEGNGLFNDMLNTFSLPLYGVGHVVKDHSVREETCCCNFMGYSFICTIPKTGWHIPVFVSPIVDH